MPACKNPSIVMAKMTRQETEALLKMLAAVETQEMALLMRERWEAEQKGKLH